MFAHHRAIPANYRLTVIEVPDDLAIEVADPARLPPGWPEGADETATAAYGTEWADSLRTAVLQVPSAAFGGAGEHNYLLNPRHPEFQRIRFEMAAEEYIDPRLRPPLVDLR
jgi:RES domain-containing protein